MNINSRPLFLFHDQHPEVGGAIPSTRSKAERFNKLGSGVFWTINDFEGERLATNCTKINAWFLENDDEPKPHQLARIEAGLYPSLIVESKKSFHVYFFARNASIQNFRNIQERLILHYNSDEKIKDPLRLMRAPGFMHMKAEPFEVKMIYHAPQIGYTEDAMRYFFKEPERKEQTNIFKPVTPRLITDETKMFFEKIYDMDHKEVLSAFSGTSWVRGEQYSFKDNRNGKHNIIVNGKQTHCFIDQNGRIGAVGGAPTIWQWLKFFGHNNSTVRTAIREVLGC